MTGPRDSELAAVRKLAEEMAKGRGERLSTGHLLAAIASAPGNAAELLRERRLSAEVLLKAARVFTDDQPDAVARAIQRARELAARSPSREAHGVHLLFALCQERSAAAYRAVMQCGSDVSKLRAASMQVALGLVGARRTSAPAQLTLPRGAAVPRPLTPSAGPPPVVSVMPVEVVRPSPAPRQKRSRPAVSSVSAMRPAGRFQLDPKRFPTLSAIGRDLTLAAARGELDPVFGREAEIDRTQDILAKRCGNCPCLVGPVGVGKTSIVRGLAQRIARNRQGNTLDDRIVIEVDPAALVAGTGLRGAMAERLGHLKAEIQRAERPIVLFLDEFHSVVSGDDELAVELRATFARGQLAFIVATTLEEYRRVVLGDATLLRAIAPIEVCELAPNEAIVALERVLPAFAQHHSVRFASEAVAAAVAWTNRYVPDRMLPDKAVSVLDLAGAKARRRGESEVGREQVADIVSVSVGVPVERLLETDAARMLRVEAILAERVVGHLLALERIGKVIRRSATGFRARRPIGTFLFLGPTGVGKTETAKAIAECLFDSPHSMTRLDMSEYAEAHAIARLVGAPPGYVGHEGGGQLTEAVRRRPYQVLLLDEIEKAHRDVLEAFLQVFDEGRMTDGRGRTVDFTNVVVAMTSNLGADIDPEPARYPIGFGAHELAEDCAYEDALGAAARAALPPELYNRIDEVIAFAPLTRDDVAEVARRMLRVLGDELQKARGVSLDIHEGVVDALLDAGGFDRALGARPMRRTIARLVEAPIAEMILKGELDRNSVATVCLWDGRVTVRATVRRGDPIHPASRSHADIVRGGPSP
jgi:ATP-dependent Clp protease ATP-binding subunit ClpC